MSGKLFIPKMNQAVPPEEFPSNEDSIAVTLGAIAQYGVVLLAGLLPIFFVPGFYASLGFSKTVLMLVVGLVVVIVTSFLALRKSKVRTVVPLSLVLFWLIVLLAFISGLLSGDVQDSLRGTFLEIQTVGFLAILGLVATVPLVLQKSKDMSLKTLTFFGLTTSILLTYNLLRIISGSDFLSLNSFSAVTISPIGSFNDLAIMSGLTIIFGLITLAQLPLKKWLQGLIGGLLVVATLVLMVVNFFHIWIVVGIFALLVLIYLLSRDTLFPGENPNKSVIKNSRVLLVSTVVVCIVSAIFIVAGDYAGGKISNLVEVNHVEVRPSIMATIDVARSVYQENVLFGIGPNRFEDAWRMYKNPIINQTIFWDTDFSSGSSYVSTVFVNIGLLGGILLVLFHLSFLRLGYRMLLKSSHFDHFWYFFGVISFAVATFIWGVSYVYVPGAGIMLLGALFTGLTFVAAGSLLPETVRSVPLVISRRRGFFLMSLLIGIIGTSVLTLFSVGKQYTAQAQFSEAQATASTPQELEQAALSAFSLYPDDRFISALAQMKLANLADNLAFILNADEPSEEVKQRFFSSVQLARAYSEQAVLMDKTNPTNQVVLANVYNNLAISGLGEALEWSDLAMTEAMRLDPTNPKYSLIAAQIAIKIGDTELARKEISSALQLKPDFTDALFFSSQMDINDGDTKSAIETTKIIISLEPQNQVRYFQLGMLLAADSDVPGSIAAFSKAIQLDPQYANARYLLALAYLAEDKTAAALEELKIVQQTNPENEALNTLLKQVESGEYNVLQNTGYAPVINDTSPQQGFENTVVTEGETDTDLIAPVNTVLINGEEHSESELVDEVMVEESTQTTVE